MSVPPVLITIVAPTFGVILSNIMYMTPFTAVIAARRTKQIGDLNPIPFVATMISCTGWTIYGCMKRDYFIYFGNALGVVLGLFYTISLLPLVAKKADESKISTIHNVMEILIIASVFFWTTMAMIGSIVYGESVADRANANQFIGAIATSFSLIYYMSPLSTMGRIIKERDSSSIYYPLVVANLCNSFMWVVYGFLGTGDIMVYGPSGVGFLLSVFQMLLIIVFHKRHDKELAHVNHMTFSIHYFDRKSPAAVSLAKEALASAVTTKMNSAEAELVLKSETFKLANVDNAYVALENGEGESEASSFFSGSAGIKVNASEKGKAASLPVDTVTHSSVGNPLQSSSRLSSVNTISDAATPKI